jgi:bacteriorhodopsin
LKGIALQHHAFGDYAVLLFTAPCMLLMMHALLYTDDFRMKDYLKMLFGVWIIFFFLGLSQLRWLLASISLAASFIIFYSLYYKYEKKMTVKGLE